MDWFGPTDFLKMDAQLAASGLAPAPEFAHCGANSPESLILGGTITEIPERVAAANPESYLHAGIPPFLIQHGDRDDIVPHQQSVNFATLARSMTGDGMVTLELIPGAGHADLAFRPRKMCGKCWTSLIKLSVRSSSAVSRPLPGIAGCSGSACRCCLPAPSGSCRCPAT